MSQRTRGLTEVALLTAVLVLGALRERSGNGLELTFVAFAVLVLLGPIARSLLVAAGRLAPAPLATWAPLALALPGIFFVYPPSPWSFGLAALGTLLMGRPRGESESPRASLLLEAAVLALAVGTGAWAWVVTLAAEPMTLPFVAVVALAVEAFGPGAPRTVAAATRRAGSLAIVAAALVAHLQYQEPWLKCEDVLVVLVLAAGIEATALVLGRPAAPALEPTPERARQRRLARIALGVAAVANVLVLTVGQHLAGERRVDLATLERRHAGAHDTIALLSHATPWRVPDDAIVLEDGVALPRPHATHPSIAAVGSGRYAIWQGRVIHYSSTDGTDPVANGRRYDLVYVPEPHRSAPARTLFALAGALAFVAWTLGALPLVPPSSLRARAALTAVTFAALLAGLPHGWNRAFYSADTQSYVGHFDIRPFLYPAFIDALDPERGAPPTRCFPDKDGFPHEEPGGRYLGAVRAQKLLTIAAVTALVWALSGVTSVWLVALLAYLGVMGDLALVKDDLSAAKYVEALMSEGLNFPLTLFWIAAVFLYLKSARWAWGVVAALLTSLLLLVRPANGALVGVLALVALFHLGRGDGWRRALVRTVVLGLVFAAPILLACHENEKKTGYFRLHAFTGMNIFCTVFEVADKSDADAFEDPKLREFMRVCTVDLAAKRLDYREDSSGDYVNINLYDIGLPAFQKTNPPAEGGDRLYDYRIDDALGLVGKKIMARHPGAFAKLVLSNMARIVEPGVHLPVLACLIAGAILYARTRSWLALFFVFFALLPAVSMVPSCVFNIPLARYRSQLEFAELLTVPLFAVVLAVVTRERREKLCDAKLQAGTSTTGASSHNES